MTSKEKLNIFTMMRIIKKIIQFLHNIKIISSIIQTITIISFFLAVNYFSSTPSINVKEYQSSPRYDFELLDKFYNKNGIKLPKEIYKGWFGQFLNVTVSQRDSLSGGDGDSDIDILRGLINNERSQSGLYRRIELLKKRLNKNRYTKHVFIHQTNRKQLFEDANKDMINLELKRLEDALPKLEYYQFLSAFIYSKIQSTHIDIKNNGQVDLEEINVYIPSPLSKIMENRNNNILSFVWYNENLIKKIERDSLGITIIAPSFKINELISLQVETRENIIIKDDLLIKFEEVNYINKCVVVYWGLIILFLVLIINYNKEKRSKET